MHKRSGLMIALLVPILALALNAYLNSVQRASGEAVVLPIIGFDPRDLLSGHYLMYQVDYGVSTGCTAHGVEAAICLRPTRQLYLADALPADCDLFIRGYCDSSAAFNAGIERFYIPEAYAQALETKVRNKRGELVVSVDKAGNAAIRDLLIDGKLWKASVP